jgi:hypothetical protein
VIPNLDSQSFDAVIRDQSTSPPSKLLVEITSACDPPHHLRMEYLLKHRHVPLWGPMHTTGNKRDRQTHIELEFVDHHELLARHCG